MIDPRLDRKIVLVTGANNPCGIGAAIARAFAAQGARLFLHYYRPPPAGPGGEGAEGRAAGAAFYHAQQLRSAEELIAALGLPEEDAHSWEADLGEAGAVSALFDRAEKSLGPVDILVNNAAHWETDTFVPGGDPLENRLVELYSDGSRPVCAESIDRMFAVNVRAAALGMTEFARRYAARGQAAGRIINVSTDGARCFPSEVSYAASKLALEGYTRSAAAELGRYGITVNAVALGPVQTGWITPALEEAVLPSIPLRRIGRPADVADVVVFLASEQARWVTGQRLYVGGGHAM